MKKTKKASKITMSDMSEDFRKGYQAALLSICKVMLNEIKRIEQESHK